MCHWYNGHKCQSSGLEHVSADDKRGMNRLVVSTPERCPWYTLEDVHADECEYVNQKLVRRRFLYHVLWSDARTDLLDPSGRRLFAGVTDCMKGALFDALQQLEHAVLVRADDDGDAVSASEDSRHRRWWRDALFLPFLRLTADTQAPATLVTMGVQLDTHTCVGPVIERQFSVSRMAAVLCSRLFVKLCVASQRHVGVVARMTSTGLELTTNDSAISGTDVFERVRVWLSAGGDTTPDRVRVAMMSRAVLRVTAWHSRSQSTAPNGCEGYRSVDLDRLVCQATADAGTSGKRVQAWRLLHCVLDACRELMPGTVVHPCVCRRCG